ncbi:hypothetical protein OE88DRAFT_1733720 [Heliocybe sulcata]|uniref:Fungal-type protein kinase domain-containing protein n=1 Tax=Heliocybe sulcata TaxID=5364 RepID=A0A5C3N7E8_9AGAM|nr:hypothetical protein OE88DRAFT_1733720 [Heliocybe sulcata]
MISADPQAEGGAKGFLIDLEYAAFLQDRRPTSTLREMTGEVCFMAIERQRGHYRGEHMVYHDLESFYWSLLYTTLRHTITNYAMRSCQSIFEQPDAIGKIAFLVQGQTELVVSHNPPLTACIQSFGLVAWESHHAHKYMTHASAIKTLDDELGKSGWPANDRARPFEPLETPFNEGIEESIHRLTGIVRATQEVYMKWKAGDADEDEQNEDVEGEPPARKRSRQQ